MMRPEIAVPRNPERAAKRFLHFSSRESPWRRSPPDEEEEEDVVARGGGRRGGDGGGGGGTRVRFCLSVPVRSP